MSLIYVGVMLLVKPWKPDAVVRLLVSVFVCVYSGALLMSLLRFSDTGSKSSAAMIFLLAAASLLCLGATLVFIAKPWQLENFMRRVIAMLVFFYAGLFLGAWVQKLAGPAPSGTSVGQMIVAALSFQGAVVLLVARFLKQHQVGWTEAFGFSNRLRGALLGGILLAILFLPVAWGLQQACAQLLTYFERFGIKPQQQPAIEALQQADSWGSRVFLGLVTILLAPFAEELLFRGILYPWIKQAGFPRLALWATSLVFAAIHGNFVIFLPLLLLALLLTLLYEKTNNLLAPITAHGLFNAMNFTMLYLLQGQQGRLQ